MNRYVYKVSGPGWTSMDEVDRQKFRTLIKEQSEARGLVLVSEEPEAGPLIGMTGMPEFYFWRAILPDSVS